MSYNDDIEDEGGDLDYLSAAGWDPLADRRAKAAETHRQWADIHERKLLLPRSMNDWMTSSLWEGSPAKLFGPFWLEYELCILFGGTGLGKSALATQIAESLALGISIPPFGDGKPVPPKRVLYCDFELTREQLIMRYSAEGPDGDLTDRYSFSENLQRTEMAWNGRVPEGFESFSEALFADIEDVIEEKQIEVLIVDNITYLDSSSTANADTARSIMQRLNDLKRSRFISILVLAHTPKRRSPHMPITEADIQGSVNLSNFADSMFAISTSAHEADLRYLKQIKTRSSRKIYGEAEVPVFRFEKFDHAARSGTVANTARSAIDNFLGLQFLELVPEQDLLADHPNARRSSDGKHRGFGAEIKRLSKQGVSLGGIAARLGVSKTTAHRYVSNA
jgi:RecA-family ATPase